MPQTIEQAQANAQNAEHARAARRKPRVSRIIEEDDSFDDHCRSLERLNTLEDMSYITRLAVESF